MLDINNMLSMWDWKYDILANDINNFKNEFKKSKTCRCKYIECRHYEEQEEVLFGKRINNLFRMSFVLNTGTIKTLMNLKKTMVIE